MKEVFETAIKLLADKSSKAHDSGDAMRLAQAALNLAQTLGVMDRVGK